MSQIDEPIPQSATEKIRDRIALIIAQEMWAQAQWKYDDDLLVDVYLERTSDFNHAEVPAVNVMYADSDMLGETLETQDCLNTFFIDVYTKANSTATGVENRADRLAALKLHKLLHVINKILMHKKYKRLLFPAPFISNRRVASIKQTNPQNPNDTTSTVWGRIEFTVRAPEDQLDILPVTLDGIDTQVQLDESAQGYLWGNNSVTPAVPVCDPATLLLNSDTYGTISSGAELNLFIVNAIGYPVGSIDGELFEISSSKIYANDTYLKAILAEEPYNLTIIDTDGDEVPITVIDENTVEVPKSTIPLNTANTLKTGITTSFYTADDGDTQRGRDSITTLDFTNPFGNTNRFTDTLGGQTYANDVVIDWAHYNQVSGTVYGWKRTVQSSLNQSDHMAGVPYTFAGYSDWTIPNIAELASLAWLAETSRDFLNYAPFNLSIGVDYTSLWSSSRLVGNSAYLFSTLPMAITNWFNPHNSILFRIYTLTELGL